jgi:hypothetical protein
MNLPLLQTIVKIKFFCPNKFFRSSEYVFGYLHAILHSEILVLWNVFQGLQIPFSTFSQTTILHNIQTTCCTSVYLILPQITKQVQSLWRKTTHWPGQPEEYVAVCCLCNWIPCNNLPPPHLGKACFTVKHVIKSIYNPFTSSMTIGFSLK